MKILDKIDLVVAVLALTFLVALGMSGCATARVSGPDVEWRTFTDRGGNTQCSCAVIGGNFVSHEVCRDKIPASETPDECKEGAGL